MPQVEITQVASKAERDAFIKFPWRIYKGDPAWVPPLLLERKEFLDPNKTSRSSSTATLRCFSRARAGKSSAESWQATIQTTTRFHQSNVGCFGLFECVNDPAVAAALFEAATQLAPRQGPRRDHGARSITRPITSAACSSKALIFLRRS